MQYIFLSISYNTSKQMGDDSANTYEFLLQYRIDFYNRVDLACEASTNTDELLN